MTAKIGVLNISDRASAGTQVTLGDMSEGEQRDVIVRLSATGRRPGSVVELLDAVLTFNGTAAGAGQLEEGYKA